MFSTVTLCERMNLLELATNIPETASLLQCHGVLNLHQCENGHDM